MTVTDHIQRCPGTTIRAKGIGSFIALLWSPQTVLLDPRRYTMVRQDALRWNWMSQAKMRASASLRQFWLTHADALHFQIQCSDSSGCNTRIKVKHQITKLLTKVLTHADALRWDRMHYGETECLKQRCVHQQVSDSSGWLMLMHFIFKFNAQTVLVAIQESKLNIK